MTAATLDVAKVPKAPAKQQSWLRRNLDLIVSPAIVVIGLAALGLWLSGQTFDSIEQRSLNWDIFTQRLGEHVLLTGLSTVLVIAFAIPLGIALSRPALRSAQGVVLAIGGFAQALPAFGLIVLLTFTPLGLGVTTAVIALAIASFLPVLTNTVVGLQAVDRSLIEAARGMGMSSGQTLRQVELPLAIPVMVAGIRVALVLNVGVAALAQYVGGGGLGAIIVPSLKLGRPTVTITAAAAVAALALLIDWLAGVAERLLSASNR